MSGVKLVGALGRDQTYVSAPRTGKAMAGEEVVGRGRCLMWVRFQVNSEDTSGAGVLGGVGAEATGAAPKGQGKTQRDLILEVVEALETLLGQGVGTQVVDLMQEHIPPPPQVTLPGSPSELERAQHLAKLLGDVAKLDKSIQQEMERVSKARLAVAWAEDDLSILQQEMKGLVNQIDAHLREDDARRERSQGCNDAMEGVFVEEADSSGEEVGVQAEGARGVSPARLLELLRGMSEEDQDTFKRNMGPHAGDDVSSIEKLVFVLKIRLKRRVFEICKPCKKFLRSTFLLAQGQGKMDFFF